MNNEITNAARSYERIRNRIFVDKDMSAKPDFFKAEKLLIKVMTPYEYYQIDDIIYYSHGTSLTRILVSWIKKLT